MGFIRHSIPYTCQSIKHQSTNKKLEENNYPSYGEKILYLLGEGCIQYRRPKRLTKQKATEKTLEGYNIIT